VTLTLSLLAAPLATTAQPRGKIPRVAVLDTASHERPTPCLFPFQQGLRDLGYVEGQTILLDYRYAEGHVDRLPALAAELVQRVPDVLWTISDPAAWAAKRATTTIPIVVGVSDGLVEQGLVASHARPGGNLTGLELPPIEVTGKRLELFKEAVPTISRVAILVDPAQVAHAHVPSNMEQEARALGVQLQRVGLGAPADFEAAFAAMAHGGADALLIMGSPLFATYRQQLLALALQHRLPTMSYGRHWAEAGSLLAYGADSRALCQRSAILVHKILHGVKPADLPIEQATFQLVVNLKMAEVLGVTISPTFLFRADEVIK
jgi:putative ABC transport system substrate-binding protein